MVLTLVRHTRPALSGGVCYGTTDVPLADSFPTECGAIASSLGAAPRVITSPLTRCRRLATALADRWGVPLATDPRWQEMDFGAWEGLAWDAVPRAGLDAWAADLLHARPHGGESVAMLLARIRAALPDADGAVVVTHAGPIRAALVATGDPTGWDRRVAFGEVVHLP